MASRSLDIIIGGRNNLNPAIASVRGSLNGLANSVLNVRNLVLGSLATMGVALSASEM